MTYTLAGLDLCANVSTPADDDPAKKTPAVAVAHPNGGVYWRTHAHPRSTFRYPTSSLLDLMRFDATDQIELITQPLLMMAGTKADSLYMTEDAFPQATGTTDKELFHIEGATHIQTYWVPAHVDAAGAPVTRTTAVNDRGLRLRDAVNRHGGDVTLVELPSVGIRGNTHVPMSDLNNAAVADPLAGWLRQKRLDR